MKNQVKMSRTITITIAKRIGVMILLGLIVLCLSSIVSATTCYQETANASHSSDGKCILNYTGSYAQYYSTEMIDGNWNTGHNLGALGTTYYVNYSYPNGYNRTYTITLRLKTNSTDEFNILLNSNCTNNNRNQLSLVFNTTSGAIELDSALRNFTISCFNSTGLFNIHRMETRKTLVNLYEEGIYWTLPDFLENNQSYTTIVNENTNNSFGINIVFDASFTITAKLIYNNSINDGTLISQDGINAVFNSYAVSPSVITTTNVPFYWVFNLTNSSGSYEFNSSFLNQSVTDTLQLGAGTLCASGLNKTLVYTFVDEDSQSSLYSNITYNFKYGVHSSDEIVLNGSLTNTLNLTICLNISQPNYTLWYGEIQYKTSGYEPRRYYMFNNTRISNDTINTKLYSLPTTSSTSFLFQFKDTNLEPYSNYYSTLLRWYPLDNTYKVVDMGKTDDKGETVMMVKVEDVDYRIGLYTNNGVLVKLANAIRMVCSTAPCTYTTFVTPENLDYTSALRVQSSLTFSNATKTFTFVWNDPTQKSQTMNLTVLRITGTGDSVICSKTAFGTTGVLYCDVSAYTGTFKASAYRTASPSTFISQLIIEVSTKLNQIGNGTVALIAGVIILILGLLIGSISPIFVVFFGVVALIPALALGSVNLLFIIGIAVIGGVIIHFMRK